MKANELMIEDWVRYKESKYPFQVAGINNMNMILPSTGGNYQIDSYEPIPLTEEILKANLKLVDGWDDLYRIYERLVYDYEHLTLCYLQNDLAFPICEISKVHELQHALRLCGLGEIADDFKIQDCEARLSE